MPKIRDKVTGLIYDFEEMPNRAIARATFDSLAAEQGLTTQPEQPTLQQAKPTSLSEAFFPSTTKATRSPVTAGAAPDPSQPLPKGGGTAEGKKFARQTLGGISDILSLPGRSYAALSETADAPEEQQTGETFKKSLAKTKGKGIIESIIRSPATPVAIATAPFAGKLAAGRGLLARSLIGGAEGAITAAPTQAQKIAEEGKPDLKSAGIEVAAGTLLPVVGQVFSKTATKLGSKIVESVIKPSKKVRKSGYDTENIFKNKVEGGLDKSLDKVDDKISELGDELTRQVKGREDQINLLEILDAADAEIKEGIQAGKYAGLEAETQSAIDAIRKNLETSSPDGIVNAEKLLQIKRGIAKQGKFERGVTPDLNARQEVANMLSKKLNEKLIEVVPEAKELNKQLSELIPIKQALKEATERVGKNFPISLTDVIILSGGGTGSGAGYVAGGLNQALGPAIGSAALLGINRLSKSPAFGSALSRTGRAYTPEASRVPEAVLRRFLAESGR